MTMTMEQDGSISSFENTEIAFADKSNKELQKTYWLFRILSSNFLTNVGKPLTNFALTIGLPIKGIIRKTVFRNFCGGENIEQCAFSVKRLAARNVRTILDYSVEGEVSEVAFDAACDEILRTILYAKKNADISFAVFKPTALGRFSLLEKYGSETSLTVNELTEFGHIENRINLICKACFEAGVKLLIDAEQSWIQPVIDTLVFKNMRKYNCDKAIIFNTYQLYCTSKLDQLKSDLNNAKKEGYILGAKLVRGAYMEKERSRAKSKGYPSPICENKQATDYSFNEGIRFCLDDLDWISFLAGTHNERSCEFLMNEMESRGIPPEYDNIYFSQLYGMSNNLSYNLANLGYNVAKYMPYGPISSVMPYLFRRAKENTSAAGQIGRELSLIIKERKRRKEL